MDRILSSTILRGLVVIMDSSRSWQFLKSQSTTNTSSCLKPSCAEVTFSQLSTTVVYSTGTPQNFAISDSLRLSFWILSDALDPGRTIPEIQHKMLS